MMNKTTTIVAVAALAAMAMVPTAQADVLARSFLDAAGGFDFGDGAGAYDPGTLNYCLALLNAYQGASPVLFYYAGLRYWPSAAGNGGSPVFVGDLGDEPTDCAGLVPGDRLYADRVQYDGGGAFWSLNNLGTNQVANLGNSAVWVHYCDDPSANLGPNGLDLVPGTLGFFGAQTLNCGGFAGSHQLYPGCPVLGAESGLGYFDLVNPVFLYDGGCNSLVGSDASLAGTRADGDFAVKHCVVVELFDVVAGPQGVERDEDHFVVFQNGDLLPWASFLGGNAPADSFPHVSNLEPNKYLDCQNACEDTVDNDRDSSRDFGAGAGFDAGCLSEDDDSEA